MSRDENHSDGTDHTLLLQLLDGDLGALLGVGFKRLIDSDPRGRQRVAPLLGRTLVLQLSRPAVAVQLTFDESGCWISAPTDESADACIRAPLHALLSLLSGDPLPAEVDIEGDTAVAQAFRDLLHELDVDWEALLADHVGDLAAHPIAEVARGLRSWLTHSGDSLLANLDNYLHEELALLPARAQLEHFYDEVDALRLRIDRLSARIDRLQPAESSVGAPTTPSTDS